jgi:SAM-dependent methyltransferase
MSASLPSSQARPLPELKPVLKGVATMVPGLHRLLARPGGGGSTDSADYCYGVWLKHLTFLWQSGMREMPSSVAELGPGDSLGVGLAALLSGASRFYALDAVTYSSPEKNLRMLDELVERFAQRAPRPTRGWPDFDGYLDSRLFPGHILTDRALEKSLAPRRIAAIRNAIARPEQGGDIVVKYIAPWTSERALEASSVDLICSHSVLEHVSDVPATFRCCFAWLRPGGWMSHQIDFTSHGITKAWNGHWQYPEWLWRIIVGGRPYLINRHPASAQARMLEAAGFRIELDKRARRPDQIRTGFGGDMAEDDLTCSSMFVQALRPPAS